MVRVLVTNDDGVGSEGIRTLAAVAVEAGHEVQVVAPAWDSSGASASLTGVSDEGRLVMQPAALEGLDIPVLAVEAAPGLIARVAMRGGFGDPPDLVLSGINHGPNTGHAVLHSGTVGAAMTAATHHCRAVAFSLGAGTGEHFATGVPVVERVLAWAANARGPLVLNVNLPNVPEDEFRGLREASLADFGAVQTHVTEVGRGYVDLSFTEVDAAGDADSDAGLLADGWATVTALVPVCEAVGVDLGELVEGSEAKRA